MTQWKTDCLRRLPYPNFNDSTVVKNTFEVMFSLCKGNLDSCDSETSLLKPSPSFPVDTSHGGGRPIGSGKYKYSWNFLKKILIKPQKLRCPQLLTKTQSAVVS